MATLFKRKGSDKWWIQIYRPGDRTKPDRISTKTSDRAEAERILAVMEGDRAKGLPIIPKAHAVQFWQLGEMVLNDYRDRELKSLATAELRLRKHIAPFFGLMTAAYITEVEIQKYRARRRAQGAKPATVRHELELVKRAFTLGQRAYKIIGPYIELPAVKNAKTGFFEQLDFEKVVVYIDDKYRPIILFAYITGWRAGEIKNLRRANIDFVNKEVRLDDSKNGDPRVFPMTEALEELLRSVLPANGFANDYVFTYTATNRKGEPVVSHVWRKNPDGTKTLHTLPATRPVGDFGKAFATACYKAGIPCVTEPWSYVNPKNGQTVSGVRVIRSLRTLHDFRRTAVRNLTNANVPDKVSMDMCGHRTRAVFDRYRITSKSDLNAAAAKLDLAHATLPKVASAGQSAGPVAGTVSRFGNAKYQKSNR